MATQSVLVDPYVVMSILDHHQRRGLDKERVEGILLGSTVKNVIHVRNFAPSMNSSFFNAMKRFDNKEGPVGWYVTGIQEDDTKLEEVIKQVCSRPLYMTVQLPSAENGMDLSVRVFQTNRAVLSSGDELTVRTELPLTFGSKDKASNVILDTIVRQHFPEVAASSDPTSLSTLTATDDQVAHLRNISSNLKIAKEYVDKVVSGKIQGDKDVGRHVAEALDTLQSIKDATVSSSTGTAAESAPENAEGSSTAENKETEGSMNDALILQYISKLLKLQVGAIEKSAARPAEK